MAPHIAKAQRLPRIELETKLYVTHELLQRGC